MYSDHFIILSLTPNSQKHNSHKIEINKTVNVFVQIYIHKLTLNDILGIYLKYLPLAYLNVIKGKVVFHLKFLTHL